MKMTTMTRHKKLKQGSVVASIDPYELIAESSRQNLIKTDSLDVWLDLFLKEAENIFGPRVKPYPIKLTEIYYEGNRCSMMFGDKNENGTYQNYKIRLSKSLFNDVSGALYSLCHESVHLLSPIPWGDTMLEEGMACWYQRHWYSKCPDAFPKWAKDPEHRLTFQHDKYSKATQLVSSLLSINKTCIKRIREIEPQLDKITPALIQTVVPQADAQLAKELVKKWFRQPKQGSGKKWKRTKVDKRYSNLFSEKSLQVHDFPSCNLGDIERVSGFTKWSQKNGFASCSLSTEVMFQGSPSLELSIDSSEKQVVAFKQFLIDSMRGKEVEYSLYTKGQNVYYLGTIILKIKNEDNALVFNQLTWINSTNDSWTRHEISFLVPAGAKILEVSVLLQRTSSLWIASPTLKQRTHARLPFIAGENKAPVNLEFHTPLEGSSPIEGWQRCLGSLAKNETYAGYKVVYPDSKVKYLKQNSVKLSSRDGSDVTDFCVLHQTFLADDYHERKISLSGMVKLVDVEHRCESFIEMTGKISEKSASFSGTADWKPFNVEIKVPEDCESITIGFRLLGKGSAYFSAVNFSVVE